MIRRLRSEAGYTLTEVLVAVVILAAGSGILLVAMSSMIIGSRVHTNIVTTDGLTRAYAEQLLSTATVYTDCATVTPAVYPGITTLPAGYVVEITNIEYGDGLNPTSYTGGAGPLGQCQLNGDKGTQRITIEAHYGPPGSTTGVGQEYLQIVKRKP